MIPVRRMNAYAEKRSVPKGQGKEMIPCQTAHTTPWCPHAPDKTSRLVHSSSGEVAHCGNSCGVFKTETTNRALCLIS